MLQSGAQVDATTKDLYTALHIAAKEVSKLFFNFFGHILGIFFGNNDNKISFFFKKKGQEEVASVLLEHKASLTATTKKGFTPLHLAAKYGNLKVIFFFQFFYKYSSNN